MYKCYSPKRFFELLFIDAIVFAVCAIFFVIGKAVFCSHAGGKVSERAVFLPVIMYHSVCAGTPSESVVTPQQAESDLRWLTKNGYKSVTVAQLAEYASGNGNLPEKAVLITLDDGFYNNLSEFLPLLEKYDMTAVVSPVGKYTDENAAADPHVPEYSYLTWDDIAQLSNSGRIEIGNHTYNMHSVKGARKGCSRMTNETAEEYCDALRGDVGLMQSELYSHTGKMPIVFAYPFGSISREGLPVLRDLGIMLTLTCYEAPNYITRDPKCLLGLNRYNRSGLYTTEEYMERLIKE